MKFMFCKNIIASVEAFRNCVSQQCFMSKARGIGYSFQLAITAPLYSITGYCIATAQSYPTEEIIQALADQFNFEVLN